MEATLLQELRQFNNSTSEAAGPPQSMATALMRAAFAWRCADDMASAMARLKDASLLAATLASLSSTLHWKSLCRYSLSFRQRPASLVEERNAEKAVLIERTAPNP